MRKYHTYSEVFMRNSEPKSFAICTLGEMLGCHKDKGAREENDKYMKGEL